MALRDLDPDDIGTAVRALAVELPRYGSPEALEQFRQFVAAFTRPETRPPGARAGRRSATLCERTVTVSAGSR